MAARLHEESPESTAAAAAAAAPPLSLSCVSERKCDKSEDRATIRAATVAA